MSETLLYSIATAAKACECSEGFLEKEIREGRLNPRKLGRLTRIERSELLRWIAAQPAKNEGSATDHVGTSRVSPNNQVIEKTVGMLR